MLVVLHAWKRLVLSYKGQCCLYGDYIQHLTTGPKYSLSIVTLKWQKIQNESATCGLADRYISFVGVQNELFNQICGVFVITLKVRSPECYQEPWEPILSSMHHPSPVYWYARPAKLTWLHISELSCSSLRVSGIPCSNKALGLWSVWQ